MTWIIVILGVLIIAAGGALGVKRYGQFMAEARNGNAGAKFKWVLPSAIAAVGLVFMIGANSLIVVVGNTEQNVLENTVSGEIHVLDSGTHIFPLDPRVIPLVTQPHTFETRKESRELGAPTKECMDAPSATDRANCFRATAVAADSVSPGRPPVYFHVKYQVAPIPTEAALKELYRAYGPYYKEAWVEQQLTSAIKSVQGSRAYDFVGIRRAEFQTLVEEALNERLVGPSGEQLVIVTQLVVENYEFTPATNQYLDTVQQKEFERQKAEQQVEINRENQIAEQIAADTRYNVEQRDAERDRDAQIKRAEGMADSRQISADAEAYERLVKAEAEAEAIRLQIEQLGLDPQSYLKLIELEQWNGKLPEYLFGSGGEIPVLPFLDVTPGDAPK